MKDNSHIRGHSALNALRQNNQWRNRQPKLTAVGKTKKSLIPKFLYFVFLFNNIEHVNNHSDGKNRSGACVFLALPTQFHGREYLPSSMRPKHWLIRDPPSNPHPLFYYYLYKKLHWSLRHDKITELSYFLAIVVWFL